jgi:hypothetical protein
MAVAAAVSGAALALVSTGAAQAVTYSQVKSQPLYRIVGNPSPGVELDSHWTPTDWGASINKQYQLPGPFTSVTSTDDAWPTSNTYTHQQVAGRAWAFMPDGQAAVTKMSGSSAVPVTVDLVRIVQGGDDNITSNADLRDSTVCLDAANYWDGAPVVTNPCDDHSTTQRWVKVTDVLGGNYSLINLGALMNDPGRVLDSGLRLSIANNGDGGGNTKIDEWARLQRPNAGTQTQWFHSVATNMVPNDWDRA